MKTIGVSIIMIVWTLQLHAQERLNKNFGIGGQVGQHQKDFGIGINMTSPYFVNEKMAVRLRGNLVWNEHINSSSETTWSSYSNFSLGFVQSVGEINNFVRIYGEGGAIILFPSTRFSSKSIQFGGYGLFGFEFFFDKHLNYFFEAGGVGTGAKADKVVANPIFQMGF